MQGGEKWRRFAVSIILAALLSGFFYWDNAVRAESKAVLINEVAWMGTIESANDEWIELYNPSDTDIDLASWKLISRDASVDIVLSGTILAKSYYLLERSDDETVTGVAADMIYTGTLGNDGEFLELFDTDGSLVDSLDASEAWPAGNNTSKKTMALMEDMAFADSIEAGGTPRAANHNEGETPVDLTGGEGQVPDHSQNYKRGAVLINEIVSDPENGASEWIELYNATDGEIDLSSWTIEDGSGAKTLLSGAISADGNGRFFLIEKPKGALNNDGDLVVLRDAKGVMIDELCYGNWDDGNKADNSAAASDPYSLARRQDGRSSGNNSQDFVVTSSPTRGAVNIINEVSVSESAGELSDAQSSSKDVNAPKIMISEILPDPSGDDARLEFVELYNYGDSAVELMGWEIKNAQGASYRFKTAQSLVVKGFLLLPRTETKLVLSNKQDAVSLYRAGRKTAVDKLAYKDALPGASLNCLDNDGQILGNLGNFDCDWSVMPSPGKANSIVAPKRAPVADFSTEKELFAGVPIVFDASDSYDPDGDDLVYSWDFGDNANSSLPMPDHTYAKAGTYEVRLRVADMDTSIEEKRKIVVKESLLIGEAAKEIRSDREWWADLRIVRLLPNPEGGDTETEWIELKNIGTHPIDLAGFSLDDEEGGSRAFRFAANEILFPGKTRQIFREESGLALNNNGDEVRLFSPDENLIQTVSFETAKDDEIYSFESGKDWQWSFISEREEKSLASAAKKSVSTKAAVIVSNLKLDALDEDRIGERVRLSGIVIALPGQIASQYFYISDGGVSLQIYNYAKKFPVLRQGDRVECIGELSQTQGELRLKTKEISDIRVIGTNIAQQAKRIKANELDDVALGSLVSLDAELIAKKGAELLLADELGEVSAYVRPVNGIVLADYKKGDKLRISGIVTDSSKGRRLSPRMPADIVKLGGDGNIVMNATSGEAMVLGAYASSADLQIPQRSRYARLFVYLGILGVVGVIGVGAYLRKRD